MISGVGIGFRREIADAIVTSNIPRFLEVAPENWIGIGGKWGRRFRELAEQFPITLHGLSLSLGSPEPLDWEFLGELKTFITDLSPIVYSEHLSYNKCDNAHLYDLLPIPFRQEAITHVAERIRQVQDFLEMKIAIENVSYYTSVAPEMDEAAFVRGVLEEADCNLLLDVNNVYVNSQNHNYDPKVFIESLPLERVSYIHMAGHERRADDLIIDTHGQPIIDPVYDLFEWTLPKLSPVPVLLERDFNFPEWAELEGEVGRLQGIVDRCWEESVVC